MAKLLYCRENKELVDTINRYEDKLVREYCIDKAATARKIQTMEKKSNGVERM